MLDLEENFCAGNADGQKERRGYKKRVMKKNIKLKKADKKTSPEKDTFFFFVKDQGKGAAKVIIIILKLCEIALTTIFALCLGILAPLSILLEPENFAVSYTVPAALWLGASVLYIAGLFFLIGGRCKTALCIHTAAALGSFATFESYRQVLKNYDVTGPTELFMPCIFITMITLAVTLILNVPVWFAKYEEKQNAKAPSILDAPDNSHNSTGSKRKK